MCQNIRQICSKYQVSIHQNCKRLYLGTFPNIQCAIDSRNAKLKKLGRKIPHDVKPKQQGPRLLNVVPIGKRFQAMFIYQGTRFYLGTFNTVEAASQALRKKRKQVTGTDSCGGPAQTGPLHCGGRPSTAGPAQTELVSLVGLLKV